MMGWIVIQQGFAGHTLPQFELAMMHALTHDPRVSSGGGGDGN